MYSVTINEQNKLYKGKNYQSKTQHTLFDFNILPSRKAT